jgi:type I restriction enzyme S subunit
MAPAPGVVIGRKGTLGSVFYLDEPYWPHDTTLWVKDFKGNHPRFCYYLLKSMELAKYDVGAANPTLNRNHIHPLQVRRPPIWAQQRIASILSAYDDLIEVNRRRIAVLEEMARRLFEEWFVHFRFPGSEHERGQPGSLPSGWIEVPLAEVCDRITDGAHHSPPGVSSGCMMASVKDMREWGFDLSGCRRIVQADFSELVRMGCKPQVGDILIAKDGANLNKHTFLVTADLPVVLLSSIAIIRPKAALEREFLVALLKSENTSAAIKSMRSGAAIPRIVLKDFKRLPILLPSKDVRQRFEASVAPLHGMCRVLGQVNDNLINQRNALLPKLISGELPVAGAEQELEALA